MSRKINPLQCYQAVMFGEGSIKAKLVKVPIVLGRKLAMVMMGGPDF